MSTLPPADTQLYDAAGTDWWTSQAPFLQGLRRLAPARLRHFRRHVPSFMGLQTLDLGCGGGFMAEALYDLGASVVGVDPSAPAVAAAQAHAAQRGLPSSGPGPTLRYAVGRAEAIPLADASADVVVCVDVLEHVSDLTATCSEIARVLRPGGRLLLDTINRTWLARLLIVTLGEGPLRVLPPGTHDPAKFIRPAQLTRLLAAAGFDPPTYTGLGPIAMDWRGLPVFGWWPTTACMYLGVAQRR